ncbi:M20 aminoacylase family protein [Phyllobacterium lublinensis]|uniref:M20 aminoacylase family protein n=1 Tax=Phyllobacterium lublinensis TaxID=2875708 RepID=UPI001CC9510B|nr:M20 aminoacylase family protein [Phyllobacterium sp. 2063]MBZ9656425.1 M20 family metallopeptidase [Phyllobacterium sp. 2063]
MPLLNRAVEMQVEVSQWRRHLHANPELMFDVHETARFVTDKLQQFGCDVVETGIGRTGVVGIIRGRRGEGPTIGLRSDMDALPLTEITGQPWASQTAGKMHACGHDGHTAMLLGAAQYLAETRNFMGSIAVIFQPAEEGGGGGREMVKDGMMERFSISEVYGMHNVPGLPIGEFAIRKGPIMAATDEFTITVKGRGGHAAQPHRTIDPVVVGAQLINALQTIVSRGTDPLDSVVLSVTQFHAGDAHNIIPQSAELAGTVRTLRPEMRDFAERRLTEVCEGLAGALGASASVHYARNYPVTFNHDRETEFAAQTARSVAGEGAINTDVAPMMAGEDFSYMLEARPGAFIFIGNGNSASLHNPAYDFNDDAIAYGISYWVQLAETALRPR